MERICFVLTVRRDGLEEYRRRHREVWPAMREALASAGWRDYTLFLRSDGLLVGYLRCEKFETAKAAMKGLEINERWQREMAQFFESLSGAPDDEMQPLEEIFHID